MAGRGDGDVLGQSRTVDLALHGGREGKWGRIDANGVLARALRKVCKVLAAGELHHGERDLRMRFVLLRKFFPWWRSIIKPGRRRRHRVGFQKTDLILPCLRTPILWALTQEGI